MIVRNILLSGALLTASACSGEQQAKAVSDTAQPAPVEYAEAEQRWFIAAANPYAVEAGAEILRRGGSAIDAAITTQSVLGLVEPQSSGLGGGAFLMHFDPQTRSLETYNGREIAPLSATPERFLKENGEPMGFYDAVAGGLSVGVPGAVKMLALAHEDHGALAWNALFDEPIRLSEEGFDVSPRLHGLLNRIPRLKQLPAAATYFYDEGGAPRPIGYVLKNPDYAQTLKALRDDGPSVFYQGNVASQIIEAVNSAPNPGGMTQADFDAYQPEKIEPVCHFYRTYQVCSMAPPSSGGVTLLQILAFLEPFNLTEAGAFSAQSIHLIFEASRLAYADRDQYLADNQHNAQSGGLSTQETIAGLLNPAYLASRAALMDATKSASTVEAGDPSVFDIASDAGKWRALSADESPEPPSTSHFTIVDAKGRVVSMTSSVEFAFGSHLMAGGMILNNQLTDFSFVPVRDGMPVANAVGAGKRPRSSMTPVMVFDADGNFYAALGSPGGPAIIGYVAKTIVAMIDWDLSVQEAIEAPNVVYPRGAPIIEEGKVDDGVLAEVRALGHEPTVRALNSGVHAVRILPDGTYDGGADSRREGIWLSGVVEDGE